VGHFLRGAMTGLGVGLLIGWSMGMSGIIPGRGWPLWAVTAVGIALIFLGGMRAGPRPRRGNLGPPG
jgi:hypothetical protein